MKRMATIMLLLSVGGVRAADTTDPREALKPFGTLVGSWKGTGVPEGNREERQNGFWTEMISWEWSFQGTEVSLKAVIRKGKHFTAAEIRPAKQADRFEVVMNTVDKKSLVFSGQFKNQRLIVERTDGATKETQRLTFRLLHSNRIVYQYDVRPEGKTLFAKKYQVGVTKEGEPFAAGESGPECIVSGGQGTIQVSHMGKTYYVCCSGCRDEFKANPEKYIKEWEAKQKSKK